MSRGPRVVVTGVGVVSAWGWGLEPFAAGLDSGETAIGDFSRSITLPSAMASHFDGAYFQYSFLAPGQNQLGLQLTELLSVEPN